MSGIPHQIEWAKGEITRANQVIADERTKLEDATAKKQQMEKSKLLLPGEPEGLFFGPILENLNSTIRVAQHELKQAEADLYTANYTLEKE